MRTALPWYHSLPKLSSRCQDFGKILSPSPCFPRRLAWNQSLCRITQMSKMALIGRSTGRRDVASPILSWDIISSWIVSWTFKVCTHFLFFHMSPPAALTLSDVTCVKNYWSFESLRSNSWLLTDLGHRGSTQLGHMSHPQVTKVPLWKICILQKSAWTLCCWVLQKMSTCICHR